MKTCFVLQRNFTLLFLKMQFFVFLLLQSGRCKEAPAFLLHTNSLSSCRCSPSDRSLSLPFDSSVVANMIGMSAAEG